MEHFQEFYFSYQKEKNNYNQIKQLKSKQITDLIIWDQFFQSFYFCFKTEKINIVTEFQMLELLSISSEKQKSKCHHLIIHLN